MPNLKSLRSAPHPLSVYLGAAMTMPDADPAAIERMIRGIKKYQAHPYRRKIAPLKKIHAIEGSTLSHCPAKSAAKGAVLLIPSMINGNEILDLLPRRSFTRWLAGQGLEVYLLDWGMPKDDPGLQTLAGALTRIAAMAAFIKSRGVKAPDAIGYCMGGTLLIGAAALHPDLFNKLALLSAPWDFHAGDRRLQMQVATGTPLALQLLEQKASLPIDWIQNVFARVNPALALNKFSNFLTMPEDSADEKTFIAVEDWLNGGQDLSAGIARHCILDWYGKNAPANGQWVDLAPLEKHAVMIIAPAKDGLVPVESAVAAMQQLSQAALLKPPCGHISLMAGRYSSQMVWQPLYDWLTGLA